MSADVVLAQRHLELLAERLPDGVGLPVVSIRSGQVHLESAAVAASVGHAVGRVAKLAASHDLYVAPGGIERSRLRQLRDAHRRGGRADVVVLTALWCDLDLLGPTHHAENLPPSEADLAWIIEQLPQPTLVLRTGGGWQCWWLLRLPLDCRSTHRLRAQRLSQAWHRMIQLTAAQRGWHVDLTHDLARILRISGSRNHKHDLPRLVVPHDDLWRPDLRYVADDLAAFLAKRLPQLESDAAEQVERRVSRERSGPGVLEHVDALPWSRIWPTGWQRAADAIVDGVVVERWRRPGATSTHSVTCWPTGGCHVHSAAVPGLPPGGYSRAEIMCWSLQLRSVPDLVAEIRRRWRQR